VSPSQETSWPDYRQETAWRSPVAFDEAREFTRQSWLRKPQSRLFPFTSIVVFALLYDRKAVWLAGVTIICQRKEHAVMTVEKRNVGLALGIVFVALISATLLAYPDEDHEAKVREAVAQSVKAAKVFDEIMHAPDQSIPQDLLGRAKAIAVFPQVIKAAFVLGAEGGRGVVSHRTGAGWSDPVFFRAGGPSVGPQIGASATDIILLFMNDEAVANLMKDRFELGAEAAVAGGPVGREASAGTDALMYAKILSYSRSRGLFAGVNLKGIVIHPEDDLNEALYQKSAHELLLENKRKPDTRTDLSAFPQAVSRYAGQ
jgi:lipid-binding SYLF domain-containing protein